MSFILLLLFICLFIGLFALAFVLKVIGVILSPFRNLFKTTKNTTSNNQRTQNPQDFQKSTNQKIFDDQEGEYVDFEEIDDRE